MMCSNSTWLLFYAWNNSFLPSSTICTDSIKAREVFPKTKGRKEEEVRKSREVRMIRGEENVEPISLPKQIILWGFLCYVYFFDVSGLHLKLCHRANSVIMGEPTCPQVPLPPSLCLPSRCLPSLVLQLQQVQESTLFPHTQSASRLELHLPVTLLSWHPEAPVKLQHLLPWSIYTTETLCTANQRTNTGRGTW